MFCLLSGICMISGYVFADDVEKGAVASINLEKDWKVEIPALEEGRSLSCYGTLRVDKDDTIWMVVNSDYTNDIVYRIASGGEITASFVLPSDTVFSINTFEADGEGALYVAGSGYDGADRTMTAARIGTSHGEVLWTVKIKGSGPDEAPLVSSSALAEDGRLILCSKDDKYPGIRISVIDTEGKILLDSIYALSAEKCIPRGAVVSDGKLFVTGETFGMDGMLCCINLSDYSLLWAELSPDLMNACQYVRIADGKIVTGGSSSMTGTTGLNVYAMDGTFEKKSETQAFVTSFGLNQADGFYLLGGGVAVNPYVEYFSYPMVSIFDKDFQYAGAYLEPEEWMYDTYIVASAVLSDGSYLAVTSVESPVRKIYLNKYSVKDQEKQEQAIVWDQSLETVYFSQEIALTAEASSGLDVSYFTTDGWGEVYVENDTLKVKPSFAESAPEGGELEIYAVQQGNTEYLPAEYVVKKVKILVGQDNALERIGEEAGNTLVYDAAFNRVKIESRGEAEFSVVDALGRVLLHRGVGAGTTEIQMENYPRGLYVLDLFDKVSHKILKVCR